MPRLDHLQREFFRALLFPLRGSSRRSTELPPSDEDHSPDFLRIAGEIIRPGPELSAAERLELYHRQYWFRILDSLAEDFPVLRRMAGETVFWQMAEQYLLGRPSRSFTLRHLGEAFADFLAGFAALEEPVRRWFAALARIEYAHMLVFEGAQGALPDAADLADAILELQDHVVLLRLPVPADLCHGWDDFSPAVDVAEEEIHLAVWREPSGRSCHERIEPGEGTLLERLAEGTTLDDLFDTLPEPAPGEDDIARWFAKWQSRRWLAVRGKAGTEELDLAAGWAGMDRMSSQAVAMDDDFHESR